MAEQSQGLVCVHVSHRPCSLQTLDPDPELQWQFNIPQIKAKL